MRKVLKRLLIFFVGIPVILGFVFLDFFCHLPLNILIILASVGAVIELYSLFSKNTILPPLPFIAVLSSVLPAAAYLLVIFKGNIDIINRIFLFSVFILMAYEAVCAKNFEQSNARISYSTFIIFYCGFLFTFITRMTIESNSVILICLFLCSVFACDSLAWLLGMLFGKNNRGYVACSPNKSVAGFIGGFIGSILTCLLVQYVWHDIFSGSYFKGALLGFLTAAASIVGDLIESVYKRSANIKDSGSVIPGRGGILDSIDSILFAAPVYYISASFLFSSF